ncbi:MAG: cell division ATP-binding protein FtsE [Clostridiales bacterium]|nr:cell division ATP-binding protein FtsE [Candidatus Crickella equi]
MIEFDNVTKNYGGNTGLNNATVHIHRGDFVFLVGPSGAGKTTFIRLILKELEPDSGTITVAGKDITHLKRREIPHLRQKIGMVFQDFRLLEKKTVYENVAFAMEVVHKSKKEIAERVPYVLNLVDIADKADRYPHELSAGEQQRVGIARAIANQPRVLICDEPTGNLDPVTAMDIMKLLEQINIRGTTIVMVTHAKDIVDRMGKRVVAIENGRIVRDEEGAYGFIQEDEVKNFSHGNLSSYDEGLSFDYLEEVEKYV